MTIGKIMIGPMLGVLVALAAYLCLSLASAADAKLFAIVAGAAVCIAHWASPGIDLRAGLKALWLFDWVTAAFPPIIVLLISSQDTGGVRVIRSIVVLIFTLSGFVCFRRLMRGKTSN